MESSFASYLEVGDSYHRWMPESEPILSFTRPNGRGIRSFDTIDGFESWVRLQSAWWNKLGNFQGQNNDSHSQWNQFITAVNQQLLRVKDPGTGQVQKNQAISTIRQTLNQYYSQQKFPESDSPEGLIVSDYFQRDPNLA